MALKRWVAKHSEVVEHQCENAGVYSVGTRSQCVGRDGIRGALTDWRGIGYGVGSRS